MPGGIHWVRLLFINLFMLGIDSAFSILEAPMVVVNDYFIKHGMKVAKWKTTTGFVVTAYCCSLFYGTYMYRNVDKTTLFVWCSDIDS